MRTFLLIDILSVTSFILSGLGSLLFRACALVATAVTTPHSGFGSFDLLAPGTFAMIKSKRGSYKHEDSTVPTWNGVSTSTLAMGFGIF